MRYALGKKVAALLKEAGLTQADLAKMLGIERASVNTWIQGRHTPSSRNIDKLSTIFGVEVNWLRDDEAHYPPPEHRRLPRKATVREDGEDGRDPGTLEKMDASGTQSSGEALAGNQPIEIINENLLRVNNPKLRALFHQLEEALRTRDAGRRHTGLSSPGSSPCARR